MKINEISFLILGFQKMDLHEKSTPPAPHTLPTCGT